jgi:hypothetical protein
VDQKVEETVDILGKVAAAAAAPAAVVMVAAERYPDTRSRSDTTVQDHTLLLEMAYILVDRIEELEQTWVMTVDMFLLDQNRIALMILEKEIDKPLHLLDLSVEGNYIKLDVPHVVEQTPNRWIPTNIGKQGAGQDPNQ